MDRGLIWHVLGKMPYHKLFCISPILYLICRLKSTQTTGHDDDEISANKMKNKIQQIIAERGKIDTSNTQIHACPRYL